MCYARWKYQGITLIQKTYMQKHTYSQFYMNGNQHQWRLLTMSMNPHTINWSFLCFLQVLLAHISLSNNFLFHAVNPFAQRKAQKYIWTVFYSINDLNLPVPGNGQFKFAQGLPFTPPTLWIYKAKRYLRSPSTICLLSISSSEINSNGKLIPAHTWEKLCKVAIFCMKNNRKTYQEIGLLEWAKEEAESNKRKQQPMLLRLTNCSCCTLLTTSEEKQEETLRDGWFLEVVLAMEPVTEVWESLEEWHRNYHLLLRGPYPLLRVFKKITFFFFFKAPTIKKMDGWYGVLYENRTKPKKNCEPCYELYTSLHF